MLGEQSLLVIH
jgi:hypothetical protein